ncbi:MAG: class I SAM-dependent methyltransferase [Flavobacteriales bacterium]|nr:class I SAM-dependent methyltransferase [Flavobacteriales bacterium]MCW8914055.1 class I SAM-dependent methyltransferase [Flavobacteriales bacterium]MCW8938113.1 class I SAM-dependent methyltransferase [Flavobacteriales bacterium]MCW8968889.1 class I SAM-dependent methyltransferase [Flavobacteriales bacterium]MCW8991146.1 class I SAM-dependent methyltransferase [Flavobacteriales bacterium]
MTKLKAFLLQQLFKPTLIGFLINPFFWGRAAIYLSVKKYAKAAKGKILDVGSGSKPYKDLFVNVTQYIGMDIEVSGHEHTSSDIDVFYDGETFPFEDSTIDSLVFFEVFEHVFNPEQFLSEIKRVVKPGGTMVVTIPFIWGEHEQPYDYARYSSFGLKHLFDKHDFEIVEHKKYLADFRLQFLLINNYLYGFFKKILPGISAWLLIIPFSFINNLLGLIFYILPKNEEMYFGNIYVLKNNKK